MKADTLRQKFLDFFKTKKHRVVDSDSLVPKDDPTILFTPAGMNQFKKQFMGKLSGFSRAASSQRCLRTDDLDKVGKTPSHHTFFEMLGNFSFGDYFKEEAINWAWEFLTEELKIKKEKLWVSVYKDDDEAYKIWRDKIRVPVDKIVKLGDKENFWPSQAKTKGPNGPCGPCSEIFVDQGKDTGCAEPDCDPSCDCGRFVEVWNLVFTQFNRRENGALEPLPKKNIDTGMGLERIAAVMQGVKTNFETDLFGPIVKEIAANVERGTTTKYEFIYAIADHIRAIVFVIYDGVLPSNEGRGYVVRKLIRRSRFHLWQMGIKKPFLYKLVPVVAQIMRVPYPELASRRENIAEVILAEEKSFISLFHSSDTLFREKFSGFINAPDPVKAGKTAFMLYDTYGIPLELTKGWLDKNNIEISRDAFERELQEQKDRSKIQSSMKGDVFEVKELHLAGSETSFLGHTKYEIKAKVLKIAKKNVLVKKASKGEEVSIILDKTPFYPESGGQVGDTGGIIKGKNVFQVLDTQKSDKVIVHKGAVKEGSFKPGDEVKVTIDTERRLSIARNHTATHLLQAALRKILGAHVQQQGSLVASDRLRFDFTHFKDISPDELNRIEETVNGYILDNHGLKAKTVTLAQAKKEGALAFFAEKYEDKVRMVSVGGFSKELCGGTHLDSTGQIGLFKIIHEGSIASGIRRIEAITGAFAYKKVKEEEDILSEIAAALNVPEDRVVAEIQKRLALIKEMEKKLSAQKMNYLSGSLDELMKSSKEINGIRVVAKTYADADTDVLRNTVDLIKSKSPQNTVIIAGAGKDAGASLVIGMTDDLCNRGLDAGRIIRDVAAVIGGSGGGRKNFAQAGGNKPQNLGKAVEKLESIIGELK